MSGSTLTMHVRRLNDHASIIDIQGSVTAGSEATLMEAYNQASSDTTRAVILNFNELEYLNSSGIGLLVTLLVRAQRQKQRLLAFGLNDHYRHIFELTRLNDAIAIFAAEQDAIAATN